MISTKESEFSIRNSKFAQELYKEAISIRNGNVIISPISVGTCLTLAAFGAAGPTADEIFSTLNLEDPNFKQIILKIFSNFLQKFSTDRSLKIANKVYIANKFTVKSSFQEVAEKSFFSKVESINFQESEKIARKINNWIERKTNNKIKNIVSPLSLHPTSQIVLISAIHFKGTWKHQFRPRKTTPEPFWIRPTESVRIPMMKIKKHFRYVMLEELDSAALKLSYKDSDLSMLILLPNRRDGLSELEEKLLNTNIPNLLSRMRKREVEVLLPAFKIEIDFDLTETLEKLGCGTMFTDRADFSNVIVEKSEPIKVSRIVHKVYIEVKEKGTEAAASTDQ
ncbi:serine protease inhibitor 42Dd-like isoform X3 [Culex pipiens pallens]|uniref:serine protease inhibitor 42Dd-like isoform X3 n=1 Tax=Culex pipiens pallens TaxID=42434 RepID=UPI001953BF79|nr:serine protease inhibitor 42Dd-like isoform X3 [Culex pipiens pallens]